jgi:hypothetical protein
MEGLVEAADFIELKVCYLLYRLRVRSLLVRAVHWEPNMLVILPLPPTVAMEELRRLTVPHVVPQVVKAVSEFKQTP